MRKVYGKSKIERCPFCKELALTANKQSIPVCSNHQETPFNPKCVCGRDLLTLHGKYGVFFNCTHCGNLTLRKVLEINR